MLYDLIYADPPWTFDAWSEKGKGRSPENHYQVLTMEKLCSLSIPSSENSILALWVTAPNLLQGLQVMNAWGYEYKTIGFTWVKKNKLGEGWFMGLGYYTRANAEFCLFGKKGKGLRRSKANVRSLIVSPLMSHSAKPIETRERLVNLFGNVSRLEMFARTISKDYTCIGNEITGNDITVDLDRLRKA